MTGAISPGYDILPKYLENSYAGFDIFWKNLAYVPKKPYLCAREKPIGV